MAVEVAHAVAGILTCSACSKETRLRHSPVAVRRVTTSGWAIASLVTGAMMCLGPIPIFLGIMGLNDVRHAGGRKDGVGLAWGGIALGALSLAAIGFMFVGGFFMARSVQQSMVTWVPQSMMYDVAQAQVTRHGDEGAYWTGDVEGLFVNAYSSSASADGAPLSGTATAANQGYWIRAMTTGPDGVAYAQDPDEDGAATTNETRYGFCIYPAAYDEDYQWTFIFDETGAAWKKDTGGAPVLSFPADPAAAGWQKASVVLPTVPVTP